MKQYPIVQRDIQGKPIDATGSCTSIRRGGAAGTSWARRAVLAIVTGIVVGAVAHDFPDYDKCRKVGGAGC